MIQFKIGDKVKRKPEYIRPNSLFTKDMIYTISRYVKEVSSLSLKELKTNPWEAEYFELYTDEIDISEIHNEHQF